MSYFQIIVSCVLIVWYTKAGRRKDWMNERPFIVISSPGPTLGGSKIPFS